jgi:hypothetical protein
MLRFIDYIKGACKIGKYDLRVLQPSPSMNDDRVPFEGTYYEATQAAKAKYKETGRAVGITSTNDHYYWYHVSSSGAINRNMNTGVPEFEEVRRYTKYVKA